ncbi:hypothetical protein [Olleya sp. UBA1516]|uniref:hypothetical protein n=1 Tax=Olleya sp. UBA1516 TaxID=1947013 RepID=UPI0025DFAAE6|nr:hypothetical protein [Olleya sp. UBA1516]|tara:strand:- start:1855 stop:2328 length:474 start_codon:yes stop_codon:yes gene_type:complete
MIIQPKSIRKVLQVALATIIVLGVVIFISIIYESKKDISDDIRFSKLLNTPIQVRSTSTIRWNKNNIRFKHYTLNQNEDSNYDLEDVKSVKKYQIGDTIYFYAAKSYKSMHVGENFYLISKDTLNNGDIIEFEYYTASDYSPEIWETEKEFLKRVRD